MKVFLFLTSLVLISCARTPALLSAGEYPIAVLEKILVNGMSSNY